MLTSSFSSGVFRFRPTGPAGVQWQRPEIRHNLAEDLSLADHTDRNLLPEQQLQRSVRWRDAHSKCSVQNLLTLPSSSSPPLSSPPPTSPSSGSRPCHCGLQQWTACPKNSLRGRAQQCTGGEGGAASGMPHGDHSGADEGGAGDSRETHSTGEQIMLHVSRLVYSSHSSSF